MNTEESRRQFEVWCKQRGYIERYYFFRQSHPNHYDDDQIEEMWMAWQASRESLPKIELPKKYQIEDDGFSSGYNCAIKESESVIIEAGYEVAE